MDGTRQRKEVYGEKKKEKKKKNKVEEIQLASLGSLASKNQSGAWYACEGY